LHEITGALSFTYLIAFHYTPLFEAFAPLFVLPGVDIRGILVIGGRQKHGHVPEELQRSACGLHWLKVTVEACSIYVLAEWLPHLKTPSLNNEWR
jgi:hypothetical protein